MSATSRAEARLVLRTVLRVVSRHLTSVNGNHQWRQEVVARFRAAAGAAAAAGPAAAAASSSTTPAAEAAGLSGAGIAPSSSGRGAGTEGSGPPLPQSAAAGLADAQGLALARDWAALVSNIARHKALLTSYNIGLDVDERTKRMVEATARRVGFALPDAEARPTAPKPRQNE